MRHCTRGSALLAACAVAALIGASAMAQPTGPDGALNAQVQRFLDERRRDWRDLHVPYEDRRILHDIVVEHGFTLGVEIGTSTGHSTIWIAWAMSKTGGNVTTIEIDERRFREAQRNVAAAGLTDYVEFVLGDAHALVSALSGPYDFVFSDADKDWYVRYFDALFPKLTDAAGIANPRGHIGVQTETGAVELRAIEIDER